MSYNQLNRTGGGIHFTDGITGVGTPGAQPATGSMTIKEHQFGPFVRTDFNLSAFNIVVTDAAGSGSSGSALIYTFPAGAIAFLGCRQDYTAFVEGAALTTAAGDAVHLLALGSVAANAGDGALTSTEVNIGAATSQITNSSGTGAGTQVSGALATPLNGTATAVPCYLNWSGTAATIDATSTIGVTGTISIIWCHMGDD